MSCGRAKPDHKMYHPFFPAFKAKNSAQQGNPIVKSPTITQREEKM